MMYVYLIVVITWLGILTIYLHRFIRRWDSREDVLLSFLMSVALLPQLLGVLSLLSFLIIPTSGCAHYYFSISLAVPVILMIYQKGGFKSFKASLSDIDWSAWSVPIIAASLVLPVLIEKLYLNYSEPLSGHDSLIYANEARMLIESGSLIDIPWFGRRLDESVTVNHPHGPLFTAFLAQALWSGDAVVRLAFQGTLICMLSGVAALGRATGRPWAATAAVLGFLTVPTVSYVSIASSRDGFRIAPLLVLFVMMICQAQKYGRTSRGDSLNLAFTTFIAGMAHALNLIFVPLVGVVGLLAGWLYRESWRSLVQWLWLSAILFLLVSLPYLANIYSYDHPLGLGVYYPIYRGTAIWDGFITSGNWGKSPSIIEILVQIQHFYGAIQTWGLFAGLFTCIIIGWKSRRTSQLFWLGLLAMLISLGPALLVVDSKDVSLSGAFSTNLRYPMAGFAFLGLAIYLPIEILLRQLGRYMGRPAMLTLMLACLLIEGAYLARIQVKDWQVGVGTSKASRALEDGEWRLVQMAQDMPLSNGIWYTDSYSPAYYADENHRPKFILTREGRPLLTIEAVPEVVDEILSRHIGMVSLYKSSLFPGWQQTRFYKVLSSCEGVKEVELLRWKVFIIQPGFGLKSCHDKTLVLSQ
jgi:hypothetical protein